MKCDSWERYRNKTKGLQHLHLTFLTFKTQKPTTKQIHQKDCLPFFRTTRLLLYQIAEIADMGSCIKSPFKHFLHQIQVYIEYLCLAQSTDGYARVWRRIMCTPQRDGYLTKIKYTKTSRIPFDHGSLSTYDSDISCNSCYKSFLVLFWYFGF